MNWSALLVALMPPAVVTVTLTVPLPAGEVAVHEVAVQDTPVAAMPPNATLPPVRLDPVTVTVVPPAAGPLDGLTPVTVGAGVDVVPALYSSAEASALLPLEPPATRTCPSGSRVAVCKARSAFMLGPTVQVLVEGW